MVKGIRSGHRLLNVLEGVAGHQPIGVSDLARVLGEEKSTVQRMLSTLREAGWIRPALGAAAKWEMSSRIHIVAHRIRGAGPLCANARPALAALRDATGETALLALREKDGFVVAEVAEGIDEWRIVPRIGLAVPDRLSASALAVLPHLSPAARSALAGEVPESALAGSRGQGFAIVGSARGGGSVTIAAPVFDAAGQPIATVVLTAPATRIPPERRDGVGMEVAATARRLSMHQ